MAFGMFLLALLTFIRFVSNYTQKKSALKTLTS